MKKLVEYTKAMVMKMKYAIKTMIQDPVTQFSAISIASGIAVYAFAIKAQMDMTKIYRTGKGIVRTTTNVFGILGNFIVDGTKALYGKHDDPKTKAAQKKYWIASIFVAAVYWLICYLNGKNLLNSVEEKTSETSEEIYEVSMEDLEKMCDDEKEPVKSETIEQMFDAYRERNYRRNSLVK